MNDRTDNIPIFPLKVVLFPQSLIPLFIFEERYKRMINDCRKNRSVFGVNLKSNGDLNLIGSTANVFEVVNENSNGEMYIVVKGVRRFRIINRDYNEMGLMYSEIEYLDTVNINYDELVFNKAVELYNGIILKVYRGQINTVNKYDVKWKDGTHSVSFHMAQKCGLNLSERQRLLTIDTENERLEYMIVHLERIHSQLKDAERIENIIKSDGYIQ
ncbi:MAG: ATP-dependent Lon protease [Chlorobi bacterium OLB4]|jgi:Lon protease-like protein|nr:MAG: ATP-dependent Lon protease [Chlorobi bacterium OLB4]MBW7855158.1 LON peptidase substrate-binding domain-containing protein [Ignavibacteria bacterium]OQY77922.1 MAG: hypothetical protein B6D43_05260 [Ignavibacteriales bacterium UTCHB1]